MDQIEHLPMFVTYMFIINLKEDSDNSGQL